MGQIYLEEYKGPLYAFIEFKVADLTVTSVNGYSQFDGTEKYSLNHITDFEHGDAYISNVVMSFSYTKESSVSRGGKSWGIGQEFNITVFDDSAIYVEDIIANALSNTSQGANCHIEYGWSANGQKIDERCCEFDGLLVEYTLSFDGPSTTLSITGVTTQVATLGTTYVQGDGESENFVSINRDITMTGNPSYIVAEGIVNQILNQDGSGVTYKWNDTTIVPTQTICVDTDGEVPKNFPCVNKSVYTYIVDDLAPEAVSEDGRSGYVFHVEPDPEDPNVRWVYFHPQESVDNTYNTANEDDDTNGNGLNDTFESNIQSTEGDIVRTYTYYGDSQRSEVISYSTDFKGMAVSAGTKFTSAIDANTNELIACEVTESNNESIVSANSASRVMGLSSGTHQALNTAMRDLWNKYATQVYTASLEILGDPNINVMEHIYLNVYTKYNQLHHTSGEYIVTCVEDSVDSGGFTTNLSLVRKGGVPDIDVSVLDEEETYNAEDTEILAQYDDRGFRLNTGTNVNNDTGRNAERNPVQYDDRGFQVNPVVNNDGSLPTAKDTAKANTPTQNLSQQETTNIRNTPTKSSSKCIQFRSGATSDSAVNPVVYDNQG